MSKHFPGIEWDWRVGLTNVVQIFLQIFPLEYLRAGSYLLGFSQSLPVPRSVLIKIHYYVRRQGQRSADFSDRTCQDGANLIFIDEILL